MQLLGPDGKPMSFGSSSNEPGAAPRKSAKECYELLGKGGYKYLDVRCKDEVDQGAPYDSENKAEAVNVPAFARNDDELMPLSDTFLQLVAENFPDKEAKIVVGCATGSRSKTACSWLVDAGYSQVIENSDGFVGWKNRGLPYKLAGSAAIY